MADSTSRLLVQNRDDRGCEHPNPTRDPVYSGCAGNPQDRLDIIFGSSDPTSSGLLGFRRLLIKASTCRNLHRLRLAP